MSTPLPGVVRDAKDHDQGDEFCDVDDGESEDGVDSTDASASDRDGNEYEDEGCDLSDHSASDGAANESGDPESKAGNGTITAKSKNHREFNDVESKSKKRDLSDPKDSMTTAFKW